MKKILFLCSHPYSGSSILYDSLNKQSRIQGFKGRNAYLSPLNLLDLTNHSHKLSNRSAIYMDELLSNETFYVKAAYSACQFIYIVREPEPVLNSLVGLDKKKPLFAARQYLFRLRRICEMAKRTPGAVLLTWQDLNSGNLDIVSEYLSLKEPLVMQELPKKPNVNLIDARLLNSCQESYERYLYFLKNQKLRYIKS